MVGGLACLGGGGRQIGGVFYFDHNATTPLAAAAREAWLRAQDEAWQNPSSPYRDAARVRVRLEAARETLARTVGVAAERIVFNSGATEGANAVLAYWAKMLPTQSRIAVNPMEHPCVLAAAAAAFPGRVARLPVSAEGVVTVAAVEAALADSGLAGVVVMAANNETGVLQPWAEIAALCRQRGVAYFCDASQWLGKLPAAGLGAAGWAIGSAHKFGGPKGTGLLVLPAGAEGFSSQRGGAQEKGRRAGTEDFPAIAAMVAALGEAEQTKVFLETDRLGWRNRFEGKLAAMVPGVRIVARDAERLWNTVSLILPGPENHRWVAALDKRGFQVSTGSACATGVAGPSHVLAAMGIDPLAARRVIRLSAGWETTEADWSALAQALAAVATSWPADAVIELPE